MYKITLALLFTITVFGQQKSEIELAQEFQEGLNKEFKDSVSSPLEKEDLAHFERLDFYPISEKFIVKATFVKAKKEKSFKMKTSTSRTPMYIKYGELHFELEGKSMVLNVYKNIELSKKPGFKDYLFLPFLDLTNGETTYAGGRYLDIVIPKSKEVILNFNKAYNPYCAYNHNYSCPLVPRENDLDIAIEAGVKKFHD
ncbi:DUF1684 domain-containing protein [Flavobacterium sp. U410]